MWGVEICKIYSKIMKKYHHCVKFTYPLSFQTRIPKVDQHTGGKWLIHGTKHHDTRAFTLVAKWGNLPDWYICNICHSRHNYFYCISIRFRQILNIFHQLFFFQWAPHRSSKQVNMMFITPVRYKSLRYVIYAIYAMTYMGNIWL